MVEMTTREAKRFSVEGRVVVLTGCTGVLGSAYCRAFAERGARLVMADLAEREPAAKAAAPARHRAAG